MWGPSSHICMTSVTDWEHELTLEAILLPETTAQYPTCIGGERRTPPEDVEERPAMKNT